MVDGDLESRDWGRGKGMYVRKGEDGLSIEILWFYRVYWDSVLF